MKKIILLLPVVILLILGCTAGGVESGLLGTWILKDLDCDDVNDAEGSWVINCDDTFTLMIDWENDAGNDFELTIKGVITANSSTNELETSTTSFEIERDGDDVSDPYDEDDFDSECSYSYDCGTLILKSAEFISIRSDYVFVR